MLTCGPYFGGSMNGAWCPHSPRRWGGGVGPGKAGDGHRVGREWQRSSKDHHHEARERGGNYPYMYNCTCKSKLWKEGGWI